MSELIQREQQLALPFGSSWKSLPAEQHHHLQHVPVVPAHLGRGKVGSGHETAKSLQVCKGLIQALHILLNCNIVTLPQSWKAAAPQPESELLAVSAPCKG